MCSCTTKYVIFDNKMHQNAFSGWAPPGPARKLTALPQVPSCIKGRDVEVGKGMEREGVEGTILKKTLQEPM